MFPLPTARISPRPPSFVMRRPNWIEPRRYAVRGTQASASKSSWFIARLLLRARKRESGDAFVFSAAGLQFALVQMELAGTRRPKCPGAQFAHCLCEARVALGLFEPREG